jgi:hypothetical protein
VTANYRATPAKSNGGSEHDRPIVQKLWSQFSSADVTWNRNTSLEMRTSPIWTITFKAPKPIPEAHAATFEQIDRWFARDRIASIFSITLSREPTLGRSLCWVGIPSPYWAKDCARAYHFGPSKAARNIRSIESKSLDRFSILEGGRFDEYAGDAERVYRHGRLIRGDDAVTFQVMKNACKGEDAGEPSFDFARDKARIYHQGRPITDVSLETFAAIRLPGIGHNARFR